jgi:hypothetical protein
MAAGSRKEKGKYKSISKLIFSFRKMTKENRAAEIFRKNSQKILEKLGMQECGLESILEHKNFGTEFIDIKGF